MFGRLCGERQIYPAVHPRQATERVPTHECSDPQGQFSSHPKTLDVEPVYDYMLQVQYTKALFIGKHNCLAHMAFNTLDKSSTTWRMRRCSHPHRPSQQPGPHPINRRNIGLKKGGLLPPKTQSLAPQRRPHPQQILTVSTGSPTRSKPTSPSRSALQIIRQWLKLSAIGSDGQSQRTRR